MAYEATYARRLQLDINMGTDAVPDWRSVFALLEYKPSVSPNVEDDTSYDALGWAENDQSAMEWSAEGKVSHRADPDTGAFHPTHDFIEQRSTNIGSGAKVPIRYYDRFGRSGAKQGVALFEFNLEGGDYKALDQVSFKMTGTGPLTSIANPVNATPLPIVASVSPATDVAAGGKLILLRGAFFTGATAVKFGTTSATAFTVVDSTTIAVNAPAHAAGTLNVTVTTPNGTSATAAGNQFIYT